MLPPKIILHPTDFSEPASQAHAAACALARDWNARLIVLHVAAKPVVSYIETASELKPEELQQKLWETLRCPADLEQGLQVEHRVVEGHAVHEILRVARDLHADLIVMGTHGHRGVLHWFSSNITDQIVRGAECSVLIERAPVHAEAASSKPDDHVDAKPPRETAARLAQV
jgi:nucleotide-binding universal stress UspA family protein